MGFLGRLPALPKLVGAAAGRGGGGAWRRPGRPYAGSAFAGRAASSRALGEYEEVFRSSVAEPEKVWGAAAEQIQWYKPWARTLERGGPGSASWFVGGELNICYNAVDRHVENGRGDQIAIIYDSPVTNTKEKITYKELLEQVSKLADVMVKHGVKKGDRVVIYMPMIPQTVYCMLACARIGAIHSLIFGGFASKELSVRIDHAKPKLIVTASFGVEPKRKVEYISLLEGALARVQSKPDKVLIYKRPNLGDVPLVPGRDLDWEEELAKAQCYKCVSVPSDHPLYILYTSGTTGLPKGVVRPTGGYAVMLNWTMSAVYGLKPGEVWWAASDLGWVVGHSYICYGPLLHGNTTVLYESGFQHTNDIFAEKAKAETLPLGIHKWDCTAEKFSGANEKYMCQQNALIKAVKSSHLILKYFSCYTEGQMLRMTSYLLMTTRCLLVLAFSCSKLWILSSSPALFLLLFLLYEQHLSHNIIRIIPPFLLLPFAIVTTVALASQNNEQGATWSLCSKRSKSFSSRAQRCC